MTKKNILILKSLEIRITILIYVLMLGVYYADAQPDEQINKKDSLLQAAVLGGDYLINAMYPDGKFIYEQNPRTGSRSHDYNILRHAGTTYAILEVYEITGEERFLKGAEKALEYLKTTIFPCESNLPNTSCVVENGQVKLGGNALAVIAMAKYTAVTSDKQYVPVMQSLARWMKGTMGRYGKFKVHKQMYPEGHTYNFESSYYPGEALLGFNRLYAIDGDSTWLDAAEKGAKWLINIRDMNKSREDLDHDHWLLYALRDLYRYRPDPLYLKHAFRITEAILYKQRQEPDPENPAWTGSYYTPPRSTPTATRTEGLVSAYHMAHSINDTVQANQILKGIELGIKFELLTQCDTEKSKNFRNPSRALGGFFESLDVYNIRIDYVQHNISAILGYHQILKD